MPVKLFWLIEQPKRGLFRPRLQVWWKYIPHELEIKYGLFFNHYEEIRLPVEALCRSDNPDKACHELPHDENDSRCIPKSIHDHRIAGTCYGSSRFVLKLDIKIWPEDDLKKLSQRHFLHVCEHGSYVNGLGRNSQYGICDYKGSANYRIKHGPRYMWLSYVSSLSNRISMLEACSRRLRQAADNASEAWNKIYMHRTPAEIRELIWGVSDIGNAKKTEDALLYIQRSELTGRRINLDH
jgi:hypothetical protein